MKTKFSIKPSTSRKSKDAALPVYLRFSAGRKADVTLKTPIYVIPSDWDPKREQLKINAIISDTRCATNTRINSQLDSLRQRTIETNIFDFDEEIYGLDISVSFLARIREERRFDSLDALARQLENDRLQCRSLI